MQPVSPVIFEELQGLETIYAKEQPAYQPLPVMRSTKGMLLSRWRLTDREREAVAAGADIFLSVHTFNQLLQPVRLEVGECDRDLAEIAVEVLS